MEGYLRQMVKRSTVLETYAMIIRRWEAGCDTYQIAHELKLKESTVHSIVTRRRSIKNEQARAPINHDQRNLPASAQDDLPHRDQL